MNHQLPEQRPQDFRIFDGSADLNVRVKSTAEIMWEIFHPSEAEVTISTATPPERADFLAACGRVGDKLREARS